MPAESKLTRNELSKKVSYDVLKDWLGGVTLTLGYADIDAMENAFSIAHGYSDTAIEEKMHHVDSTFIKDIATDIHN